MSNKIKREVLFLLHTPPPIHGSSIVGELIKKSKLINENFNCHFINLSTSSAASNIGSINIKKFILFIKILKGILQFSVKSKNQIVYFAPSVTDWGYLKDFFLVVFLKIFNKNLVYHLHNKGVAKKTNFLKRLSYKFFFHNVKVILLSERLYEDVQQYVDRKNVSICPNGVDVINSIDINSKSPNSVTNLLFLSNMMISKGVVDLIRACGLLKKSAVQFKLTLIGAEVDVNAKMIENLKEEYDLVNEVEYLGIKTGFEKHSLFLSADIFVFPTYYSKECFPLVLLEAMQYGLPIISTNEGAILDIVKHNINGLIAEKKSPLDLSKKISDIILNYDKMENFGNESRKHFLNYFTNEIFEENLLAILYNISQE